MRKNEKQLNICLNEQGIDAASETAQKWMNEAGVAHDDVLRIRLALEELLDDIRRHYEQPVNTELSFRKRIGSSLLQIRYEGDRFDPSAPSGDEVEDLTQFLLTEIGTQPYYRLKEGTNELLFRIPSRKLTPEVLMLICIAAGIAVGLAGSLIPSGIRTGIIDFGLSFSLRGIPESSEYLYRTYDLPVRRQRNLRHRQRSRTRQNRKEDDAEIYRNNVRAWPGLYHRRIFLFPAP